MPSIDFDRMVKRLFNGTTNMVGWGATCIVAYLSVDGLAVLMVTDVHFVDYERSPCLPIKAVQVMSIATNRKRNFGNEKMF